MLGVDLLLYHTAEVSCCLIEYCGVTGSLFQINSIMLASFGKERTAAKQADEASACL